jgi:hypothetical protein
MAVAPNIRATWIAARPTLLDAVLDHHLGWHRRHFAVHAPARDRQRRHHAHRIADGKAGHALADGADDARCLIAQPRRKRGGLDIQPRAEHRFGPVQAQRLDPQRDFAGPGRGNLDLVEAQHFGAAVLVDAYNARHGGSP